MGKLCTTVIVLLFCTASAQTFITNYSVRSYATIIAKYLNETLDTAVVPCPTVIDELYEDAGCLHMQGELESVMSAFDWLYENVEDFYWSEKKWHSTLPGSEDWWERAWYIGNTNNQSQIMLFNVIDLTTGTKV